MSRSNIRALYGIRLDEYRTQLKGASIDIRKGNRGETAAKVWRRYSRRNRLLCVKTDLLVAKMEFVAAQMACVASVYYVANKRE